MVLIHLKDLEPQELVSIASTEQVDLHLKILVLRLQSVFVIRGPMDYNPLYPVTLDVIHLRSDDRPFVFPVRRLRFR